MPQRVTATLKRESLRLLRLETEREAFLTTPEHPFATPRSGWLSAGRLAPDDWIVSERFGAVRLTAVHNEPAPRPVPVFNLSVASSHAYFVGTDQLLVHNGKCKPSDLENREEAIQRLAREREEINRQIKALQKTAPTSPQLAELKLQRSRLRNRISKLRRTQQRHQGVPALSKAERVQQHFEADREAARRAREATQEALVALESQPPTSEAEKAAFAARKAKLERQLAALTLSYDRTSQILTWLRALAELEQETPATDADRQALEEKKEELQATLNLERARASALKGMRRRRADPQGRAASVKYDRELVRRQRRTPAYLADAERPRDPLERLEDELAGRLQEPPSESRDAGIDHITDQIETMKSLVQIRKEYQKVRQRRYTARTTRRRQHAKGQNTDPLDQKIEQLDRELHAIRIQRAQLRVRGRLLAQLAETPWARPPSSVNEARLRAFEHQLAAGLENEQQLADIEQALDAMDPSHTDQSEPLLDEVLDVDPIPSERDEQMRPPPAPERAAAFPSSYERLQRELREARAAVEIALSALANEHAHIQTTQAGSSSGPTWQDRLRANQEQQAQIRAQWHQNLQTRLDSAQRQLHLLRSLGAFRDEAIETELHREIALLERELHQSG